VHRHPLVGLVAAVVALTVLGVVAVGMARRPAVIGPLAVLALPFRVPIQAGAKTSNLLVPLYLVVAAGSLAWIVPVLRDASRRPWEPDYVAERDASGGWSVWVERLLALYVVLYGIQAVYSPDFQTALQQMVFFYVPFTLLYRLLRDLRWTPLLIRRCLQLIAVMAVIFSAIGFVEYATKTIILNPKLVVANGLHTYFTVNSVFFDPDIFGRFLALVMVLLAVILIYERPQREQLTVTVVLAVLWAGLLLTLSRSSLGALLVGLGVLAALRWRPSRALVVAVVVLALGAATVALSPTTFGLNQGLNGASSGRANLVTGGIHMFGDRPLWGYGSGSFVHEYRVQHPGSSQTLSASHTIPVTIGAEQGLVGELPYIALVIVSAVALLRGARSDPARAAIAAAFLALMFHTMLYADFLEDPVTWTLLAIGLALARAGPAAARAPVPAADRAQAVPA
jgi:putative inorganic carbon (HCO3(-)) transporter